MRESRQGLTRVYNRVHDPAERSPAIVELRRLRDDMDAAVLEAYGWADISSEREFTSERVGDEQQLLEGGGRAAGWRFRWQARSRDEALARLLALNQRRYADERTR